MAAWAHRYAPVNGLTMHYVEQGEGPLVLLLHGWPESWYSWRHQLPWLAALGYRVVAPDMRGYGGSDAPDAVDAYAMRELVADVVGLIDHHRERSAVLIGHDWGAMVAWQCALLAPERVSSVIALSVPYSGRSRVPPTEALRAPRGAFGAEHAVHAHLAEYGLDVRCPAIGLGLAHQGGGPDDPLECRRNGPCRCGHA